MKVKTQRRARLAMLASAGIMAGVISGCATPINSSQKQELRSWQAKGMAIEEKSPGAAVGLGFLPGGGSFYTGNIGVGVVNLLFWPLSIFWDPVSGYDGAVATNYYTTKVSIDKKRNKEISTLEDDLLIGKLSKEEFVMKKRHVEEKYSPD